MFDRFVLGFLIHHVRAPTARFCESVEGFCAPAGAQKPSTLSQNRLACDPGFLDNKFAVTHDGEAIHFDSAATWDDINVNFGIPIGTCKFGIWIAKGNV